MLAGIGEAFGLRYALDHRDCIRANLLEHPRLPRLELLGGEVGLVILRGRGKGGSRAPRSELLQLSGPSGLLSARIVIVYGAGFAPDPFGAVVAVTQ